MEGWCPACGTKLNVTPTPYVRCMKCKISWANVYDLSEYQPERPNPEACEHKLVYREPNPETMSPAMKAKYELAKKLTGCDGLNTTVM